MNNYSRLLNRVRVLEHIVKNEGKQVGTLYHVCTLDDVANYIVPSDSISGSGSYKNWLMGGRTDIVSFTRDKSFIVNTRKTERSTVIVQFEVDGDLLSNNKKIFPYNDMAFDTHSDGEHVDEEQDDIPDREMEECVIGTINHFSRFITSTNLYVTFDMFKSVENIERTLDALERSYSYLQKIGAIPLKPGKNKALENKVMAIKGDDGVLMSYKNLNDFMKSISILKDIIDNKDVTQEQIETAFSPITHEYLIEEYLISEYTTSAEYSPMLIALFKYRPEYINSDIIDMDTSTLEDMLNKGVISYDTLYRCFAERVNPADVLFNYRLDDVISILIKHNFILSNKTRTVANNLIKEFDKAKNQKDTNDKSLLNHLLKLSELDSNIELDIRDDLYESLISNDDEFIEYIVSCDFKDMYKNDISSLLELI